MAEEAMEVDEDFGDENGNKKIVSISMLCVAERHFVYRVLKKNFHLISLNQRLVRCRRKHH